MRERLSRGKRVDNHEWVEGYYVSLGKYHYILTGKLDLTAHYPMFEHFLVDPETVGDYTELPDKNGRKIFEGDIIKWHDNSLISVRNQISEVCFGEYHDADSAFEDDKALGFYIRLKDGSCISICALNKILNDFKIIGNIYDNPELLEVKQNG